MSAARKEWESIKSLVKGTEYEDSVIYETANNLITEMIQDQDALLDYIQSLYENPGPINCGKDAALKFLQKHKRIEEE